MTISTSFFMKCMTASLNPESLTTMVKVGVTKCQVSERWLKEQV